MLNKKINRLNSIFDKKSRKTLLVAFDHGVEHGPAAYEGIDMNPLRITSIALQGRVNGLIVHSGVARNIRPYVKKVPFPLIIKITGRTSLCKKEIQQVVTTVREAEAVGGVAVAYTVYVGSDDEPEMLKNLAIIKKECLKRRMPLIGFMYPRVKGKKKNDLNAVRYAARLGAELGVDIVKTYYTGSKESFARVVEDAGLVQVISGGGPKTKNEKEFLKTVKNVMDAGAVGMAIGRNVWSRDNGVEVLKEIRKIIHGVYQS